VKQYWDFKVTKSGVGDGVVASVPAGIDCGSTCGSSYEDGTVVTLTATPDSSSEFEKWGGACSGSSNVCSIPISGSANVVASFKAKEAPPPKVGATVVGGATSGKVTYKLPGSNTFALLTGPVQFPNGTIVNTKEGHASIASAEGNGKIDVAEIWNGVVRIKIFVFPALKLFGVDAKKKLYGTQFTLVEKLDCTAAGLQTTKRRKLWGSGKGKFRTKGRYSSATVRGTKWYVEDRCNGTLTKVAKGVVGVQDFVRKKLVLVDAGHEYFASAKAPKKAKRR
jgi:Divergent InlB B-repeat domain